MGEEGEKGREHLQAGGGAGGPREGPGDRSQKVYIVLAKKFAQVFL